MNGQDLPIVHGGPVRLVVPGWAASTESSEWRQFIWRWEAAAGAHLLASRATDLAGNIQPADVPFNQKGYVMHVLERVPVRVE